MFWYFHCSLCSLWRCIFSGNCVLLLGTWKNSKSWTLANIYLFQVTTETPEKVWNMFKVNNIYWIKVPERRYWRCSGAFIINFERTYFSPFSSISIVDFELVNVSWLWSCRLDIWTCEPWIIYINLPLPTLFLFVFPLPSSLPTVKYRRVTDFLISKLLC